MADEGDAGEALESSFGGEFGRDANGVERALFGEGCFGGHLLLSVVF